MTKPFDTLFADLEKRLLAGERNRAGADKYFFGIGLIRESLLRLRVEGTKVLRSAEKEKEYFREVWPVFHSRLLLYIRLYEMELRRSPVSAEVWPDVIGEQENRVEAFFRRHRVFWLYYSSGGGMLDEQFTRAYSCGRILEPLAVLLDPEGAALASYLAARYLAMRDYGEWLRDERGKLTDGAAPTAEMGYTWGATVRI